MHPAERERRCRGCAPGAPAHVTHAWSALFVVAMEVRGLVHATRERAVGRGSILLET